jgi:carbamoyl-phosphate synthase large subunit
LINVLFSSAGRRVGLINCFRQAASDLGIKIQIIAIDHNPEWSPACQIADKAFAVQRCLEPGFIDQVEEICIQHGVNVIIPTIDTELMVYAENRKRLSESGVEVLVSDPKVVSVARDKSQTTQILRHHSIPVPATWNIEEVIQGVANNRFPLLLKPRDGSCSAGIMIVNSLQEFKDAGVDANNYIAQETCQGEEYTINAYYKPGGRCAACVPHWRKFVRAGEVCLAETIRLDAFSKIAHQFSEIFPGIRGTICFQGFKNPDGDVSIFEINARFGGGYPICDRAGGTFARWILQEFCGQVPNYNDDWQEGVRMLRYDDAVFAVGN